MTDRLNALTVVLEQDLRTDDAEALIQAIHQLRGVLSVEGHVADVNSTVAYQRARLEVRQLLFDTLDEKRP